MGNYVLLRDGDKITIQSAEYIEDGWYIEIQGNTIVLYEIPLFGGQSNKIGEYGSIIEAIDKGDSLT